MLQSTEVVPTGPATEMVPPVGTISMADGAIKHTGTESSKLRLPETVDRHKILWTYLISIVVIHLLGLLAFVPWLVQLDRRGVWPSLGCTCSARWASTSVITGC